MKRLIIISTFLTFFIFGIIIGYFSLIGLETNLFNNQIKKNIYKIDKNLDLELKKVKIIFNPLKFEINAKSIGPKIKYKNKIIELEKINTQISLVSLIKKNLASTSLQISTKSINLIDLKEFLAVIKDRPELDFLESNAFNGFLIADIQLNFDENGKIVDDYKISGNLKEGSIDLFEKYNLKKINFLFDLKNKFYNFQNINFSLNENKFLSEELKITNNISDFFFEGKIKNETLNVNKDYIDNIINLKDLNLNFKKISFSSINNFSFNLTNEFKFVNLNLKSEIKVNEIVYKKPILISNLFSDKSEDISLTDHDIILNYVGDNLSIRGSGNLKLEREIDKIDYVFSKNGKKVNLNSKIQLNELNLKKNQYLVEFFPELADQINLKNHQIDINYLEESFSINGSGKIKIQNEFDDIIYSISNKKNSYKFETNLTLNQNLFKVDFLNYQKEKKSEAKLFIEGNFEKNKNIVFNKLNITESDNKILIQNLVLDNLYKFIKVDLINLNYLDSYNKKNQLIVQKKETNNYEINGASFNATTLINNLLEDTDPQKSKIFKEDLFLTLKINQVYIDDESLLKDLNGKISIKDSEANTANIDAFFDDNTNFKYTININQNEKVTTLFSAKAKPFVKRYKFIKGFDGGSLDFTSIKSNDNNSESKLKIYDFKLNELPALTKLLTLASLKGISDLLSGEGISFKELEMNFQNNGNLMTINELYAIGPSISILMDGYIEKQKLVSLSGTLVPAATVNKVIGYIPVFGKILVGSQIGEGIFGVSFKIKGPPKNLETTVNPIKTLTPRFITRTLEKIKNY
ncbi:MAG: hypothetical protein CK535_04540 [Pelagibacteraceae bacterium]|nr:MAG: hypothetical protein CK535_04540 [Pelagibacteraceae bacterium]